MGPIRKVGVSRVLQRLYDGHELIILQIVRLNVGNDLIKEILNELRVVAMVLMVVRESLQNLYRILRSHFVRFSVIKEINPQNWYYLVISVPVNDS